MKYTILSGGYANKEHTAAVVQTKESGLVLISKKDTPDLWEDAMKIRLDDFVEQNEPEGSSIIEQLQRRLDILEAK